MNAHQKYNPECALPKKCIHDSKREHDKDRHLQAEHNMTLKQYREMQIAQDSQCGICDESQEDLEMRVDSYGGSIHGLLCKNCITRINGYRALVEHGLVEKIKNW